MVEDDAAGRQSCKPAFGIVTLFCFYYCVVLMICWKWPHFLWFCFWISYSRQGCYHWVLIVRLKVNHFHKKNPGLHRETLSGKKQNKTKKTQKTKKQKNTPVVIICRFKVIKVKRRGIAISAQLYNELVTNI